MKNCLAILFSAILLFGACKKDSYNVDGWRKPVQPVDQVPRPPAPAVTEVAGIFQSGMVIQRDKPFKIWGQLAGAGTVYVKASWNDAVFPVTLTAAGRWEIIIPSAAANATAQTIEVTLPEKGKVLLQDVLIGDVWVCAGQSNMAMPVGAIAPFGGVENYATEIAAADYPLIRLLSVPENWQAEPATAFSGTAVWKACSPQTVGNMSAAAYFFGRNLFRELNVPVGLIVSAVNGSGCESWTNAAGFATDPQFASYSEGNGGSQLYNGMISPFAGLAIRGFTWYQGENNQHMSPASTYTALNTALIKGWRAQFGQGELPFYYVQITPFDDGTTGNPELDDLAIFREAQANIRALPGTGMVVTMDIGEVLNHHPRYKQQVGDRLARLALNGTYGKNVPCIGPQFAGFTQAGNTVTVNFKPGTADGLVSGGPGALNQLFFVAGGDKVFRKGNAAIVGNTIRIDVPGDLPQPVKAIRYAFTNFPITNLQNGAGLPAEPFRTDDWNK